MLYGAGSYQNLAQALDFLLAKIPVNSQHAKSRLTAIKCRCRCVPPSCKNQRGVLQDDPANSALKRLAEEGFLNAEDYQAWVGNVKLSSISGAIFANRSPSAAIDDGDKDSAKAWLPGVGCAGQYGSKRRQSAPSRGSNLRFCEPLSGYAERAKCPRQHGGAIKNPGANYLAPWIKYANKSRAAQR